MADFVISIPELGKSTEFQGPLELAKDYALDFVQSYRCAARRGDIVMIDGNARGLEMMGLRSPRNVYKMQAALSAYTWQADIIVPAKARSTFPRRMPLPWSHYPSHWLHKYILSPEADCPFALRDQVNERIDRQIDLIDKPTPGIVLLTHLYDMTGFVAPRPPDPEVAAAWESERKEAGDAPTSR